MSAALFAEIRGKGGDVGPAGFGLRHVETTVTRGLMPGVVEASVVPAAGEGVTGVLDDSAERRDGDAAVRAAASRIAALLRESQHCVVYTGAGISTAARIPDYRGPEGVWTRQAKGLAVNMPVSLEQAEPTYGHMALAALHRAGRVAHVVSTNIDGLHLRSGIPLGAVSELHGDVYLERCSRCGAPRLRPFPAAAGGGGAGEGLRRGVAQIAGRGGSEATGRACGLEGQGGGAACRGTLRSSVVPFGEQLPPATLREAEEQSRRGDLSLVLGTSMCVYPAAELPMLGYKRNGGALAIVNLQPTPYDKYADARGARVFASTDDVLRLVCEELGVTVPAYEPHLDGLESELRRAMLDNVGGDHDDGDMGAAGKMAALARENFAKGQETGSYWAVVDAQSDFAEWSDEYWSPDPAVALADPIIFGKVEVQVRKVDAADTEWEEDGAGEETAQAVEIGTAGKPTSLQDFQTALLAFTAPLAKTRALPSNLYHLKYASANTMHLFMGD